MVGPGIQWRQKPIMKQDPRPFHLIYYLELIAYIFRQQNVQVRPMTLVVHSTSKLLPSLSQF